MKVRMATVALVAALAACGTPTTANVYGEMKP